MAPTVSRLGTRIAALALPLLLLFPAAAQAQLVNPQYTTTTDGNGGLIITAFSATGSGPLNIPGTITGLTVTSIGASAFNNQTGVTSVTIPSSVTSIGNGAFAGTGLTAVTIPGGVLTIGNYAFQNCASLTSATIPSSVTSIGVGPFSTCAKLGSITVSALNSNYSSVGGVLFNNNQTTLIQYPAGLAGTSYTIPGSVTSIGEAAFAGAGFLSATMPNSLTSIGNYAFYKCISMNSLTIPNGVISLGDGAFENCGSLSNVTIPDSVTTIGNGTFANSGLSSVTIGSGVITIGIEAFFGCSGLTGATLPASLANIGAGPFADCTGLTSIAVSAQNTSFISVGGVLFNHSQNTLIQCPAGLTNSSYTVGGSVTTVGAAAFYGCNSLTRVTIPASVTSVGQEAFYYCGGLTSAVFMGNAPTMGGYVFTGAANGFTVTYYQGTTGFSTPIWTADANDTYSTIVTDPFSGSSLGSGWNYSAWFGTYNSTYYPWINDASLGFIYVSTSDQTSLYLYVVNGSPGSMGWLYTTPSQFPSVYSFSKGTWLYYSPGTTSFYNYSTPGWEIY